MVTRINIIVQTYIYIYVILYKKRCVYIYIYIHHGPSGGFSAGSSQEPQGSVGLKNTRITGPKTWKLHHLEVEYTWVLCGSRVTWMLDEHVFSIVCMVCGFCFLSRSSWFVLLHVFLLFLACPLLLSFKRLLQSQWWVMKSLQLNHHVKTRWSLRLWVRRRTKDPSHLVSNPPGVSVVGSLDMAWYISANEMERIQNHATSCNTHMSKNVTRIFRSIMFHVLYNLCTWTHCQDSRYVPWALWHRWRELHYLRNSNSCRW